MTIVLGMRSFLPIAPSIQLIICITVVSSSIDVCHHVDRVRIRLELRLGDDTCMVMCSWIKFRVMKGDAWRKSVRYAAKTWRDCFLMHTDAGSAIG
jgi:hypothetical protein